MVQVYGKDKYPRFIFLFPLRSKESGARFGLTLVETKSQSKWPLPRWSSPASTRLDARGLTNIADDTYLL